MGALSGQGRIPLADGGQDGDDVAAVIKGTANPGRAFSMMQPIDAITEIPTES